MRIAVTAATDEALRAPVAQHFGHAPHFVLVDVVDGEVREARSIANPFLQGHQPGQIPQFLAEQGAEVVLSGGMGGRAIGFFEQFGIAAASGAAGTVADSVADYLAGRARGAEPCAESVAHGHA